jgi:hypothetical protein
MITESPDSMDIVCRDHDEYVEACRPAFERYQKAVRLAREAFDTETRHALATYKERQSHPIVTRRDGSVFVADWIKQVVIIPGYDN